MTKTSDDHTLAPGTPIWFDLPTPNREAGKEFYSALFGWDWHEFTSVPLGTYSLATMHGRDVAALMDEGHTMRAADSPKMWRTFFWTDDLEAAAKRCEVAGGKIISQVNSHGDLGRSIECTTHEGVPFVMWSGRDALAGDATVDQGTPHWTEYYTRDVKGSNRFFGDVLGIQLNAMQLKMGGASDETYTYHFMTVGNMSVANGEGIGGMIEMDDQWEGVPNHMMVYFAVEDCDATAKLAADNGGRVCVPPTEIPSGRFSVLEDPQGCTFSVLQSNPDWKPPTN